MTTGEPTREGLLTDLEHMGAAERAEHDAEVSGTVAPDREITVGMGETLLAVDGLTVRFGGLTALDDVSFDVKRGEILGLIGPNGAGKTTCFNIMTGVYRPSEGDIRLEGQSLATMKRYRIIQTGIARTFQNIRLFGAMTALENVVVGTDARHRTSIPGAARVRRDRAPRRGQGDGAALRRPAPARDRAGPGHRAEGALPRRACGRLLGHREGRAVRAHPQDP